MNIEYAQLRYLLRLSSAALVEQIGRDDFATLLTAYMEKARAEHQTFREEVLARPEAQRALNYDYEAAAGHLEEATQLRLPSQMYYSNMVQWLGTIEAWREYITSYYLVATTHAATLEGVVKVLAADWQSRSLAQTEQAARSEAIGVDKDLHLVLTRAQNLRDQCRRVFERLDHQWNTISRMATILQDQVRTGDMVVQTRLQRGD